MYESLQLSRLGCQLHTLQSTFPGTAPRRGSCRPCAAPHASQQPAHALGAQDVSRGGEEGGVAAAARRAEHVPRAQHVQRGGESLSLSLSDREHDVRVAGI